MLKVAPEYKILLMVFTSLAVFIKRSQAGAQISALIKVFYFFKMSICYL